MGVMLEYPGFYKGAGVQTLTPEGYPCHWSMISDSPHWGTSEFDEESTPYRSFEISYEDFRRKIYERDPATASG
jgi:hypothetical protein